MMLVVLTFYKSLCIIVITVLFLDAAIKKFYNCTLNRQRVTYSFVITFDTQEKLDF